LWALQEIKAMKHVGRCRVVVRYDRLASSLGCSVRTAGRILADLEHDDYIQRVKRRGHDGVLVEHQGAPREIRPTRVLGTIGPFNAVDLPDYEGPGSGGDLAGAPPRQRPDRPWQGLQSLELGE
jgi:hypothetical protein